LNSAKSGGKSETMFDTSFGAGRAAVTEGRGGTCTGVDEIRSDSISDERRPTKLSNPETNERNSAIL
jgi:hypothetical protein